MALSAELVAKFWKNVLVVRHYEEDWCWPWLGHLTKQGYGQIAVPKSSQDFLAAHRISWMIHKGEIPEGKFVCHHCDNRDCVNPKHLFLGDAKANREDTLKKGRLHKKICKHGHLLEPRNLFYFMRNGVQKRTCLTCYKENNRKGNLKKKELRNA